MQTAYRFLADGVVVVHLSFVLFVLLGGLLVARWPRLVWVHIPAAVWGGWVEVAGWVCPLTPLENWLRQRGGAEGYASDFLERYLVPVLYPESLTREIQYLLGMAVVVFNVIVYAVVRWRRSSSAARAQGVRWRG